MTAVRQIPWVRQLASDRRVLRRAAAGHHGAAFGAAAARLADSRYAADLEAVLARDLGDDDLGISLARGRRALVHEHVDDALALLTRAQSLATARTPLAVGRIAFLIGAIHLGRDEEVATDAVLAWAEGYLGSAAETNADLLHLRALLAERRGERDEATRLYRRVLQRANAALTPMTRALAMRNLAATLAHSYPRESAGLYAMALATLDADELDASTRATIDNGMGYALLCAGDVEGARLKLQQAQDDATKVGNERIDVYAAFNLAIADELRGDAAGSDERLAAVDARGRRLDLDELVGWTAIRRAWLRLRDGRPDDARAMLRAAIPGTPRTEQREAVATLDALMHLGSRRAASRETLATLAKDYAARGDDLTAFTLTLWTAHADASAGRVAAARRSVARACAIGAERGFRLGTSWWAPELVAVAREHAAPAFAEYADGLVAAGTAVAAGALARVAVARDGSVRIAGADLDERAWREGRSGSGVLRRFFRVLVSAYPAALSRDELADLLWPDSEGDRAVRNLYDATKDLRRVLARIPGARLEVSEGRYGLAVEENVTIR